MLEREGRGLTRGQIAFEFMIVYSFVLIVFLVVFVLIASNRASLLNAQEYSSLQLAAQNVAGYINQAVYAGTGYNVSIPLTGTVGTLPYNVMVASSGVVIASAQVGSQVLSAYAFSSARNLVINGTLSQLSTNAIRMYVLPNGTGYLKIYNLHDVIYVDRSPVPTSMLAQNLNVTQIANIKAAYFNGAGSYMLENGIAPMNDLASFTIAGWANLGTPSSVNSIIYSEGSPTNGLTLQVGVTPSNTLYMCTFDAGTPWCGIGGKLSPGQWHFFVAEEQVGSYLLQVDNSSSSGSGALIENSFDSRYAGLGYSVGNVIPSGGLFYGFNGLLADVQTYNTSLSAAQVAELAATGIAAQPVAQSGITGWYRLDGDPNDYSTNRRNMLQSGVNYDAVSEIQAATMAANGSAPFVSFGGFTPVLTGFVSGTGNLSSHGNYAAQGSICGGAQNATLTFNTPTGSTNVTVTGFNGNASYVSGCGHTGLLAGWWPLDEGFGTNAHDLSTFYDSLAATGTWNGYPAWKPINVNFSNFQAANFIGSQKYGWITANQIGPYNTISTDNAFTVVAWVDYAGANVLGHSNNIPPVYTTQAQGIAGDEALAGSGAPQDGFQLTINGSSCGLALMAGANQIDASGSTCVGSVEAGMPVGKWVMVVGEYASSGTARLYVNTTLSASAYFANEPLSSSLPFNIGNDAFNTTGGDSFNGTISNVQLYNTALNASAIGILYRQGATGVPIATNSLLGWWPLATNTVDLSAYRNNGTVNGAVSFNNVQFSSYPTTIKPQYALAFNPNSGNQLESPGTVNLLSGNTITVAAWIDPSQVQLPTSYIGVFRYGPTGGCPGGGANTYSMGIQSSGVPEVATWCDDFVPSKGPSVNYNSWNFEAGILDGNSVSIFLNGEWVNGSTSNALKTVSVIPGPIVIGSTDTATAIDSTGDRMFNGSIADVQVYNTVLSPQQVWQLYEQGLPPVYKLNVSGGR